MKNHKKRHERKKVSYVYLNRVMSLFFLTVVYANGIYQTKAGDSTELPERGSTCNVSGTTVIKFRLFCWWIKNVEANLWIRVSAAETLSNAIVLSRSIVFCTVWYSTVARRWSFDRLTRPHSMALCLQNNRVPEF